MYDVNSVYLNVRNLAVDIKHNARYSLIWSSSLPLASSCSKNRYSRILMKMDICVVKAFFQIKQDISYQARPKKCQKMPILSCFGFWFEKDDVATQVTNVWWWDRKIKAQIITKNLSWSNIYLYLLNSNSCCFCTMQ